MERVKFKFTSLNIYAGLEEFRFPEAEPIRNLGAIKHVGDAFHTLIDWGVFENQEETFKEISSLVWREVGRIISAPPYEVVTPEEDGEDPTLYELYHDILKVLLKTLYQNDISLI